MRPYPSLSDLVAGKDRDDRSIGNSDTATSGTGETEADAAAAAAAPAPEATMDDYFFKDFVRGCRNVVESTSYLEIFNYSVSMFFDPMGVKWEKERPGW